MIKTKLILSLGLAIFGFFNLKSQIVTDYVELPKIEETMSEEDAEKVIIRYIESVEKKLEEMYNSYTNDDIVGYIQISNTRISYPILVGKGNNYYLNFNEFGEMSSGGSIFLDEKQNSIGEISIIHGHNMLNGTMFTDIQKFLEPDFFNSNYINIYDGKELISYNPVAIVRTDVDEKLKYVLNDASEKIDYVNHMYSRSLILDDDFEATDGKVVILNTCVSDGTNNHYLLIGQEVK